MLKADVKEVDAMKTTQGKEHEPVEYDVMMISKSMC